MSEVIQVLRDRSDMTQDAINRGFSTFRILVVPAKAETNNFDLIYL